MGALEGGADGGAGGLDGGEDGAEKGRHAIWDGRRKGRGRTYLGWIGEERTSWGVVPADDRVLRSGLI